MRRLLLESAQARRNTADARCRFESASRIRPSDLAMDWHRLKLPASVNGDQTLLREFASGWARAGAPRGAVIYRAQFDQSNVYYFNPDASAVAQHVLFRRGAERCIGSPDLTGFCRVAW